MTSALRTAVVVATVTVSTMTAVACGGATSASSPRPPSASGSVTAGPGLPPGTITIRVPGYGGLGQLAVTSGAVWLGDGPYRINPGDNTIGRALSPSSVSDISAHGNDLWASDYDEAIVRRYDAASGRLVATIQLPSGETPEGIAITPTAVWVASHHGGTLDRIDPATNTLRKRVAVTSPGNSGAQFTTTGFGSVWVGVSNIDSVVRVDPRSNRVLAKISFHNQLEPCGGLAATNRAVWVSECLDGTHVGRIDPRTNKVTKVLDTGGKVIWMAADRDSVWFVTGGDPEYAPNDPGYLVQMGDDGKDIHRYPLGDGFTSGSVVIAFGSLWVASSHQPVVLRIPLPAP